MSLYPWIRTLGDVPRFHAANRGSNPAFIYGNSRVSYAEWHERCKRVAQGLITAGVEHGGRIGFVGRNSDAYFDVLFGVDAEWRELPTGETGEICIRTPVLPRNASGKVQKTELRKPYWSGQDRQVN